MMYSIIVFTRDMSLDLHGCLDFLHLLIVSSKAPSLCCSNHTQTASHGIMSDI
jgi:hypothetical protein